jgi:hypothetical protein
MEREVTEREVREMGVREMGVRERGWVHHPSGNQHVLKQKGDKLPSSNGIQH